MRGVKDAYSYRVAPSDLFLGPGSTPKDCINFLLDTLRPFSDRIVGRGGDNEILSRYTHSSSIDGVGFCSSAAALVIAIFMRRYVEAPEWFVGRQSWSVLCGAGFFGSCGLRLAHLP